MAKSIENCGPPDGLGLWAEGSDELSQSVHGVVIVGLYLRRTSRRFVQSSTSSNGAKASPQSNGL